MWSTLLPPSFNGAVVIGANAGSVLPASADNKFSFFRFLFCSVLLVHFFLCFDKNDVQILV